LVRAIIVRLVLNVGFVGAKIWWKPGCVHGAVQRQIPCWYAVA
jgi:hypothetical protein